MGVCSVLAVLGNDDQLWTTLDAAVNLADAEHARLTLAMTTGSGEYYMWLSPFAFGGAYLPPPLYGAIEAERLLARAVRLVPAWLPVTTRLVDAPTQNALLEFILRGHHDVLVAGPQLFVRYPTLARDLDRGGVASVCSLKRRPRGLGGRRRAQAAGSPVSN